ncbi:hypothetical protein CCUS01_12212 [Colletotrichum cuscutae]|uniref:Uncharacterized protein n=1 Tax=Colletotrichum cuscutae TaxID=1209917 RepID=A0AAI9TVJ7_9PEZI|nr:hypothetical protein CCUS01_12212 [Colletotrichum cuscutae]
MATHERQRSERGVMLYAPERAVGLPNAQFPQGILEVETFVVALVARNKWRKMVTADGMRPNCDGVTYLTMPKLVGQGHSINISVTNQILLHFTSSISAYYNSKKMVAIKNLFIATLISSVIATPLLSGRNVPDIEVDSVASIETRAEAAKNRRQNMKDQLDQEIRRKQNGGW